MAAAGHAGRTEPLAQSADVGRRAAVLRLSDQYLCNLLCAKLMLDQIIGASFSSRLFLWLFNPNFVALLYIY